MPSPGSGSYGCLVNSLNECSHIKARIRGNGLDLESGSSCFLKQQDNKQCLILLCSPWKLPGQGSARQSTDVTVLFIFMCSGSNTMPEKL